MTDFRFSIQRLGPEDLPAFRALMTFFGRVFDEMDTYTGQPPGDGYVRKLLASDGFFALAAFRDREIVGGLTAYEWVKFERERSEIYVYDLAVDKQFRRRGIATDLINHMRNIAQSIGAYVVIIEADTYDASAIALYDKLGRRENVLHFDIPVEADNPN